MKEIPIDNAEIIPNAEYAPWAINFPPYRAAAANPIWNVISSQVAVAVRDLRVATDDANEIHRVVPNPNKERKTT